ncbi:MAG TPA: YraN family protein [Acidimicrobiales bacterium]|nr:YraN family protein [Acidimicrobiales bacterium]
MADAARAPLGARGEEAAAAWYRAGSYEVLDRNWRCAEGELDVVALSADGEVLVICEVKTRSSDSFGSAFDAVTPAKQRRLRKLAARWLSGARRGHHYERIRFDVAAVTRGDRGMLEVEVLEDAF